MFSTSSNLIPLMTPLSLGKSKNHSDPGQWYGDCPVLVGVLVIGFHGVVFLPSQASCSTMCLKTVVGLSKGMLSVKYFCPNKASFWCQSNLMLVIRLLTKIRSNLATLSFVDTAGFKILVSVCNVPICQELLNLRAFYAGMFFW